MVATTSAGALTLEPEIPHPKKARRSEALDTPLPHLWTLTHEEAAKLHAGLLRESLASLLDQRTSAETRRDIVAWVSAPLVPRPRALSFQACAAVAGVAPEALRELLLSSDYVRRFHLGDDLFGFLAE